MEAKLKVYEGILIPLSWDASNKVTKLGLYTSDQRDLIISCPKVIKKLRKKLGSAVKLQGYLFRNDCGEDVLQLKKINFLKKLHQKIKKNLESEEDFSFSLPKTWEGEASFA